MLEEEPHRKKLIEYIFKLERILNEIKHAKISRQKASNHLHMLRASINGDCRAIREFQVVREEEDFDSEDGRGRGSDWRRRDRQLVSDPFVDRVD
eukprot:767957-Hanusia_phi.AAC.2